MRAFYQQCAGVLAIGAANRAYYRSLGIAENRISLMPYAVDNVRFAPAADLDRATVRVKLGIADDKPIILYAAKFSPRKRPGDLIRAAAVLKGSGLAFHLVMVGSGELEGEIRTLAERLDLHEARFPGFVNQKDLPALYAASDIFVLPSEDEPWGLAVNEAMCAGLPVVVAEDVGCVADLVGDGINGRTFVAGDIAALTACLSELVANPLARARMGAASRKIIAGWSFAECLKGLREALDRCAP